MSKNTQAMYWQQLSEQGMVSGEQPEALATSEPWYVRTMLGIAGWIGALFLLGSLFAGLAFIVESSVAASVLGGVTCLLAVLLYRSAGKNDFINQFAFAISLAGQTLIIFGVLQGFNIFQGMDTFIAQIRLVALVLVVLQGALFLLVPNYLHQVWSAFIGVGAVVFLLNQHGFYPFTLVLLLAALTLLWLQEFRWVKYGERVRALGYALVLVTISHLLTQNHFIEEGRFWQDVFGIQSLGGATGEHIAALCLGLVLLGLVVALLRQASVALSSGVAIASLVLAGLIAVLGLKAPGIPVGLVIVLIGFAHANHILTGLGLLTLVGFVSQFYYLLHLTLLEKSLLLCVSGLVLLAVRLVLKRYWPKGATHA